MPGAAQAGAAPALSRPSLARFTLILAAAVPLIRSAPSTTVTCMSREPLPPGPGPPTPLPPDPPRPPAQPTGPPPPRGPNATDLAGRRRPFRLAHERQPERQAAVRAAMEHAWRGYSSVAWGADELDPVVPKARHSWGMGLTLVDSLDTLHLMNLTAEFDEAVAWVGRHLRFTEQEEVNVFEATIRVLAGLLSAYELSGSPALLDAAAALGERLLVAFDTPTGLPYGTVGFRSLKRYNPAWCRGASSIAEVGSLQLEFRALSRHTGRPIFEAAAQRIMSHLRSMSRPAKLPVGLYPTFIHPVHGEFASADVTLGARADSLYEYLLKQWLISGRTDARVAGMYTDAVRGMVQHMVRRGGPGRCSDCTYIGKWNYQSGSYDDRMDHLVCFVPGMLALGVHAGIHGDGVSRDPTATPEARDHMALAERLMDTCHRMYSEQPTGLAPEIAHIREGGGVAADPNARHNLLRPETVESLFVLWWLTGEPRYREWGWTIFLAFERHCKLDVGYSGLSDVTGTGRGHNGRMDSFFLAETLKYLFLLFGDGRELPLDDVVLNTEAHPLRIHPDYRFGSAFGSLPDEDELVADRGLGGAGQYEGAVRDRVQQRAELLRAAYPRSPAHHSAG